MLGQQYHSFLLFEGWNKKFVEGGYLLNYRDDKDKEEEGVFLLKFRIGSGILLFFIEFKTCKVNLGHGDVFD